MTQRKSLVGAAVTSTSRAKTGEIKIEGNKGGILTAIELQVFGVLTTVVDLGGLVELINGSIDWIPFEFYTNMLSAVSAGGAEGKVLRIPVHKKLPANSTVTIYYTPHDAASQKLAVTLHWETNLDFDPTAETFSLSDIGTAADCSGGVDPHNTIDIPAQKGGICRAILIGVCGAITTVKNTGGLLELKSPSSDPSWEPFHIITHTYTAITEGGISKEQQFVPCLLDLPDLAKVTSKYTAQHTVNSNISIVLLWTPG